MSYHMQREGEREYVTYYRTCVHVSPASRQRIICVLCQPWGKKFIQKYFIFNSILIQI
jgi:hypothetical protein